MRRVAAFFYGPPQMPLGPSLEPRFKVVASRAHQAPPKKDAHNSALRSATRSQLLVQRVVDLDAHRRGLTCNRPPSRPAKTTSPDQRVPDPVLSLCLPFYA